MKTLKNKYLLFLFAFANYFAIAQVMPNPRQVIGSNGGSNAASWGTVDYTVGEPMIQTFTSGTPFTIKTITQGFQQPENTLGVIEAFVNSTCIGGNNGSIALTVFNAIGTVTYTWVPSSVGTSAIGGNLPPGVYNYTIADSFSTISGSVTVGEDPVPCVNNNFGFYTGITPNGDGTNENWQIDSIINFPDNSVSIYNRWGDLVWFGKNYDNVNVVWEGKNKKGQALPDATYFYLVEIPNQKYKGWVELTR